MITTVCLLLHLVDIFEPLYDVIGQDGDDVQVNRETAADDTLCLVFEWMDHELRTVPSHQHRQNPNLPKIIAKSVLSALALLKTEYNAVHTGESRSL